MKNTYRAIRAVVMAAVMTVVAVYLILYVSLSIPFIQDFIKDEASKELSEFLKTDVSIEELRIVPFNRVSISGLTVKDQNGENAVKAERVGAGIDLFSLLFYQRLVFTHAELIGPDFNIYQSSVNTPYNIQFIIDAFKPKDPNKPPTKFDFRINNIIIRKGNARFRRLWLAQNAKSDKINFNNLEISGLKTDISLPSMKNDDFYIDIRRLSFKERSGFNLQSLSGRFHVSPQLISFSDLILQLPGTKLSFNNQELRINGYNDIPRALTEGDNRLIINDGKITPSDFRCFVSELKDFNNPISLDVDISGNIKKLLIRKLNVRSRDNQISAAIQGNIRNLKIPNDFSASLNKIDVSINRDLAAKVLSSLDNIPDKTVALIKRIGSARIIGKAEAGLKRLIFTGEAKSDLGSISIDSDLSFPIKNKLRAKGIVTTDGFNLGKLINNSNLGTITAKASADLSLDGKNLSGHILADASSFQFNGKSWTGIHAQLDKAGNEVNALFSIDDIDADINGDATATISGINSTISANIDLRAINFKAVGIPQLKDYNATGYITANLSGLDIDAINGNIDLQNVVFNHTSGKQLYLGNLQVSATNNQPERLLTIESYFLNGNINGDFKFKTLPATVMDIAHGAFPDFIPEKNVTSNDNLSFDFTIKNNNTLTEYFNLPIRLLTDVRIDGIINGNEGIAKLNMDCPYLQQGKNKLIRETALNLSLNRNTNDYTINAHSMLPGKNGDINIGINAIAKENRLESDIKWKFLRDKRFDGLISLAADITKSKTNNRPEFNLGIRQSEFAVNDTIWTIHPSNIRIHDKNIIIDDLLVNNNTQYIDIRGTASPSTEDSLLIGLKNIDLDYIFETLNINYVTFGGRATGIVTGKGLLSSNPVGETEWLKVDNLTYNNSRLGDAILSSYWDNHEKKVGIKADISDLGKRVAIIDGGVWVTRDSLSFGLDAQKVDIGFLKPFMAAFTSDVRGKASGKALLYGTFSDIDLVGNLFADTIGMKVDYTNTWYYGSDSVIIRPGHIEIPDFRLYDKYGNSAMLAGDVRHRFFHEPSFNFRINKAKNLLCYDTNSKINPDWYGTIFGSGGGRISGRPGIVDILVEMTTSPNSTFTFVLSDTEAAADYKFLTFTDRRKEAILASKPDTVPEIIKAFRKKVLLQQSGSSAFNIDLRTTVTPEAQMILVMDPIAGDKIKAYGSGALQIAYGSETDKMTMYGKYTLEKGNYNFTLQDIIIKDFTIRPGSSISFNGDPLNARLDIDAVYKVNTSLADLDKSFSTDRDLNRTSVPVEAVLKVDGDLQSPEISFDIELPTLTQNVERKVKSIISTDDMMQRQIIYLLALNRFYTPEYMSGGSNNELSSIASSTITSQLRHMMSNLTDKWTISPYIHSDNGQFTDMEVDLALSSSLLNNRLLLNGNFGYRDKSTSSTTFIGDFDIEYLLNRKGSLRLKAYNHYNDKNYYLRSALTTQGVGIMYKHDFDRWFSFLRKWRKKKRKTESSAEEIKKNGLNEESSKNL